ncbi:MAG: UDP-glucose/GDP-mannose dehydrogenase family protein, partial [Candidatus Eremiobacteraeota bacterium]|nr:UDP-glucose/GDP-mannose dehydrogenase family protein [Candidatus Eremiobacteraeota bacterium]
MRIGVFGAGYVGLVSAVGFAEWGHDVVVCEREARKVESIRRGVPPFSEPGLAEALARNLSSERLRVTGEALDAIRGSDAVFVAVGTPMRTDRRPDLRAVFACCDAIARHATEETTLVLKSTVPVDALDALEDRIRSSAPGRGPALAVNPEFLRQGSALRDFLEPDRVVVGTNDERSRRVLEKIYASLDVPRVATDLRTAALVKYASNAFLAVRVSFI